MVHSQGAKAPGKKNNIMMFFGSKWATETLWREQQPSPLRG
jgi:hypothetical protein